MKACVDCKHFKNLDAPLFETCCHPDRVNVVNKTPLRSAFKERGYIGDLQHSYQYTSSPVCGEEGILWEPK